MIDQVMATLPFDITFDLAFAWVCLIALAVLIYVILDGFDLGLGILFPVVREKRHREMMMNSVAPVWDGNETWLVLGGGGLFAVFPLAYSVLFTALYMPLILMLLALIFRGVAFEFTFKDERHRDFWEGGFAYGSIFATFAQGLVLGAYIQGIAVEGRGYAGGWFDWLTPFSIMTGVALLFGYALLGAGWLVMKTEGELQRTMYRLLPWLGTAVLVLIALVSLWTPLSSDFVAERWFTWPNLLWFAPVPILVAVTAALFFLAVAQRRQAAPFLLSLILFWLAYTGLGISHYPYIVPFAITYREAAAPDDSLAFILVGAVILLPIILTYSAYSYWVFRGKVREGEGYH